MNCLEDIFAKRRSIYNLGNKILLKQTEVEDLLKQALKDVPSAFNSQSSRIVLLLNQNHTKLWNDITLNTLKAIVDEDKFVRFIASFTLDGKISENDNVVKLFTVSGDYSVVYYKQSDVVVTKEFFDVFKELSLSTIVWPYFREYIQNMVSRTGLPPFVLPSKIIAKSKKD